MMIKCIMRILAVAMIAGCTACSYSNDQVQIENHPITKIETTIDLYTVNEQSKSTPPPPKNDHMIPHEISRRLEGIVPAQLSIPTLEIDAIIEPVSITESGQMDVPARTERVGILTNGVLPGMVGNAVIDGHVDNHTGPAVFFRLKNIKRGDIVSIKNEEGCKIDFMVESIEIFKTSDAPISKIFGSSKEPRLNLITCTGKFDRKNQEYSERLVVFAKRHSNNKICESIS